MKALVEAGQEYNEEREEGEAEVAVEAATREPGVVMPSASGDAVLVAGRVLLDPLAESPLRAGRREYDCVFMEPGRVVRADGLESNWLIPAKVIQEAAPLFDGVSCYVDHPEQWGLFGGRQAPKVKDLAGVTFDAHWSEAESALCGRIRLYDREPGSPGAFMRALIDEILADQAAGREVPAVGLSAVFYQETFFDEEAGLRVTERIVKAESVDFVYSAGARGCIRAALSAMLAGNLAKVEQGTVVEGGSDVSEEGMKEGIVVGAEGQVGVTERLDELTRTVAALTAALAEREEARTVVDMGDAPRSRVQVGPAGVEQVELALEAMILGQRPANGVRPLSGIRELYHLLSGDYEMTGIYQSERVYLANVTSSTMAALVANALNKRVATLFQAYPRFWEPAVTIEDFASLQDVRWIVLGGVGELPTVAEGAAYTELTWDDKTETAAFVKKGGYLGLTIEAIDKDDTRRLRLAPQALAQAAWMTLGKTIAEVFTANSDVGPTLADTYALFQNANHANIGSTALSLVSWRATKILMMKQTELHSAERLGALTAPRFCWVPIDLEDTAVIALASERIVGSANNDINVDAVGNERETRLANARRRVITVPFWTDADNWAAQADPVMYPSIGLGFRYGRVPEVFSVADPRGGLMFSNDVMPVKVRFLFAVGAIDYRGLYKHNV